MSPDEVAVVGTVYEALAHEWSLTMARHDVPAGWLVNLHARLSGPEFCNSGVIDLEVWRFEQLLAVEARLDEVLPGYLAAVLPSVGGGR